MLIDWYTVAAQVINFLILIFLLKHFLYGRIIAAMDRREKRIADRLRDADEERAKAQEQAAAYRARTEEMEQRRSEMMAQAKEKADEWRSDLMAKAQAEVEQAKDAWYAELEREKDTFLRTVRERSVRELTALVRKVLSDLAGTDLERQIVRSFAARLQQLDQARFKQIAAESKDHRIIVRTAFPLDEKERSKLQKIMEGRLGTISLDYATNKSIAPGIVLEIPGIKIGWTLEDYMNDLEQALLRATEPPASREAGRSGQTPGKSENR